VDAADVFFRDAEHLVRYGHVVVPPDDFHRLDDLHEQRMKHVIVDLHRRIDDLLGQVRRAAMGHGSHSLSQG